MPAIVAQIAVMHLVMIARVAAVVVAIMMTMVMLCRLLVSVSVRI